MYQQPTLYASPSHTASQASANWIETGVHRIKSQRCVAQTFFFATIFFGS